MKSKGLSISDILTHCINKPYRQTDHKYSRIVVAGIPTRVMPVDISAELIDTQDLADLLGKRR